MTQLFSNAGRGELAATIIGTDTTITIVANGAAYPVANTGAVAIGPGADWFKCVLQDATGIEIVYVRTHTASSLSFSDVLRGQEGTTARGFDAAATVFGLRVTAGDHTEITAQLAAKATLGANTLTGNQTLGGNKIINPLLEKTLELRASPAIAAGVLALDLSNGISAVALNANITSITFANNAASATACQSHTLEFTADGTARTVTWPAGDGTTTLLVKWVGGTAPTLTSTNAKRDTFIFKSVGQFLWDAYVVGQNS